MNRSRAHYAQDRVDWRLYQDREKGMISGICAGIASYFAFNLTAVRLLALLSLYFFTTLTLAIYFVLAFLLRDRPHRYRGRCPEAAFRRNANTG